MLPPQEASAPRQKEGWERGDPAKLCGPQKLSVTASTTAEWRRCPARANPALRHKRLSHWVLPDQSANSSGGRVSVPPCMSARPTRLHDMGSPSDGRVSTSSLPPDVIHASGQGTSPNGQPWQGMARGSTGSAGVAYSQSTAQRYRQRLMPRLSASGDHPQTIRPSTGRAVPTGSTFHHGWILCRNRIHVSQHVHIEKYSL